MFTRRPPEAAPDGVEFAPDLREWARRPTEWAGSRSANVLGAETARRCLHAGLLDDVLLLLAPVMLGEGVRVLARPGGAAVELDRLPDTTEHWYRVRR